LTFQHLWLYKRNSLFISIFTRWVMGTERRYCSICAWRENCQKKYSVSTDAMGRVHCPDYTRDLSIKDKDVDEAERKYREKG